MFGEILSILSAVIGVILTLCGLFLTYRGASKLLRVRKDPSLKEDADYMSHSVQNVLMGLCAIGAAGLCIFVLRSSFQENFGGSINLKNLPFAFFCILMGFLVIKKGPPVPKREIKFVVAYLRLKIFGFRVTDAVTVVTEICESVKEDMNCTDKLRANMDLIATKFQELKAMKKGTISSALEERYKDLLMRLMSLQKNNPDAKGWEKETTEIAARLM